MDAASGKPKRRRKDAQDEKRTPLGATLASGVRPSADEVQGMFERLRAADPAPRTELEHLNAYTLLVAVVMSAQATDVSVNKATEPLFAVIDTPQKMIEFGEEKLREAIRKINFHTNKAKNVIALSRRLVEEHGGVVPHDREILESFPGVGRKSASVVLNVAFGEPTIAVDTHVFRVSNRTGLAPAKEPLKVQTELESVVPEEFRLYAHHWLILHGRYVCKARKPECGRCIIAEFCKWPDKTL